MGEAMSMHKCGEMLLIGFKLETSSLERQTRVL